MMKYIVTLVTACALSISTMAQDKAPESLFNSNELGVSLSTAYTVENGEFGAYDFNLQVGTSYFFTKNFGVEAVLPFYTKEGVVVREVSAGLLARVPVTRSLAPYLGAGSVYVWGDGQDFNYYAKAGVEFRTNSKWGVFTEGLYRVLDFDNSSLKNGAWSFNVGVRLNF